MFSPPGWFRYRLIYIYLEAPGWIRKCTVINLFHVCNCDAETSDFKCTTPNNLILYCVCIYTVGVYIVHTTQRHQSCNAPKSLFLYCVCTYTAEISELQEALRAERRATSDALAELSGASVQMAQLQAKLRDKMVGSLSIGLASHRIYM